MRTPLIPMSDEALALFSHGVRKVKLGVTDFASIRPDLVDEWSPENDKKPHEVLATSGYRAKWICRRGHETEAVVNERSGVWRKATGCPYCSGRKVLPGETDLLTVNPALAAQWHPTRNLPLTPDQVTGGSNRKVWWLGPCKHEWQATVIERRGTGRGRHKGSGCPVCAGKNTVAGYNDLPSLYPLISAELDEPGVVATDLTVGSNRRLHWKCDRGHTWQATVVDRVSGHGCGSCVFTDRASKGEEELAAYITKLLPAGEVQRNVRWLLGDWRECDIYVPGRKLAVEYNGVYWHSDATRKMAQTTHAAKWRDAAMAGIQLVQVWEDDWRDRREIVERMLAAKLGVAPRGLGARKTVVQAVSQAMANEFLDRYHLQGAVNCRWNFGLFNGAELVAVIALKTVPGSDGRKIQITRYATAVQVAGGFTKLLVHANKILDPEEYETFSDHMVSNGALYRANGFVKVADIPADYSYLVDSTRVHKFNYRLKRFERDPTLVWQSGLSEKQLAELNGLHRVWDAGKTKWSLTRQSN